MGRECDSFQPNIFCKLRCQNCYKTKDQHSEDALEKNKMSRKVKAQGFLYVAPSNIDFSLPSHTSKKWQRRYFKLYDDGELSYGLDSVAMPATKMDMNRCIRVCEADAITGHSHSILVAFCVDDLREVSHPSRMEADELEYEPHPAVCYLKAESTDEIRWWQNNLQTYINQQTVYCTPSWYRRPSPNQELRCEPTVIQVNDTGSRRSSPCSSRCSTPEGKLYSRSIDLGSRQSLTDTSSHHGTVRSVKNRNKNRTKAVEAVETVEICRTFSPEVPEVPEVPLTEAPPLSGSAALSMFRPTLPVPAIDTSQAHTLRKGWLLLRGRTDTEWSKRWVVLAGLSLKMYKDVWLEDSSEPLVSLDLKDCVNVYPSETAKHYGIEIKCKRSRYVLSAMTPGIRDSWIQALQQNLHNPSPTYVDNCPSVDGMSLADSEARRKKHIAYVAPESHHSNSMMDSGSSSTDEDDLMSPLGSRRHGALAAHRNSMSASDSSDNEATDTRGASSPLATLRRRSPLARVKDKSTKALRRRSSQHSICSKEERHKRRMQLEDQGLNYLKLREKTLQQQVENLRDKLRDATQQLVQTKSENDELRKSFKNCDPKSLAELRRSLNDAEDEIKRKQQEMDVLRDKLHSPTEEHEPTGPPQLTVRLVNLLQTQVGGISKFLHSTALDRHKFAPLRPMADALIRKVAEVSMEPEEAPFDKLEEIFHDVINAYEALSSLLIVTPRVATKDSTTLTEPVEEQKCDHKSSREYEDDREDLLDRIAALEEKNEDQEHMYKTQIVQLEGRIVYEQEQRKTLLENIEYIKEMNEQTVAALHQAESERIAQIKAQHKSEMDKLKEEHEKEMEEDKIAMKRALDAVRRVHEEELEQTKQQACTCSEGCSTTSDDTRASESSHVADRLKSISAQYSAKCLEHSQLEEKVSTLMSERREAEAKSEMEMKRFEKRMRAKDDVIEELREKVDQLEKKLLEKGASAEEIADYLHRSATKRSRSRTVRYGAFDSCGGRSSAAHPLPANSSAHANRIAEK